MLLTKNNLLRTSLEPSNLVCGLMVKALKGAIRCSSNGSQNVTFIH